MEDSNTYTLTTTYPYTAELYGGPYGDTYPGIEFSTNTTACTSPTTAHCDYTGPQFSAQDYSQFWSQGGICGYLASLTETATFHWTGPTLPYKNEVFVAISQGGTLSFDDTENGGVIGDPVPSACSCEISGTDLEDDLLDYGQDISEITGYYPPYQGTEEWATVEDNNNGYNRPQIRVSGNQLVIVATVNTSVTAGGLLGHITTNAQMRSDIQVQAVTILDNINADVPYGATYPVWLGQ